MTGTTANETPLPRAGRERMQRINARLQAQGGTGDAPPQPPVEAGNAPPPVPPSESQPGGETPPAPPAPPPTNGGDPRENDPTYWKQRFQVLQGMLRSNQERSAAQVSELERKITELQAQVSSREASRAPEKIDLKAYFTPEQIERFGEEQCEAMARTAMTAAAQQAQALIEAQVKPMQEREQRQAQRTQADNEAAFWEKLAELYPDYQEVNARQDWLEWLVGIEIGRAHV